MPAESRAYRSRVRKQRAAKRKRIASEYDTDKELIPIFHFESAQSMQRFLVRSGQFVVDIILAIIFRGR
jgi:hypothetical protein